MSTDRDALATSLYAYGLEEILGCPDESLDLVADAVLASDWLAEHDERIRVESYEKGLMDPGSAWMKANAEHDRQVAEHHRHEWADYLSNWSGAVGPTPPTAESIIEALRADTIPFGHARASRIEAGE